jgi:hypothetical protein
VTHPRAHEAQLRTDAKLGLQNGDEVTHGSVRVSYQRGLNRALAGVLFRATTQTLICCLSPSKLDDEHIKSSLRARTA